MEEVKYKFIAFSRTGFKEVFPKNGSTFAISYEKKDKRALFSKELKGTLTFIEEDYHWLRFFEDSVYKCDNIDLVIQKKCGENYIDFFTAKLSLNRGKWNLDSCQVDIEATVDDKYSCYENSKDTEYNLFSYIFQRQTIAIVTGTIEIFTCDGEYTIETGGQEECDFPDPELGWIETRFYQSTEKINNQTETYVRYRREWAREKITSSTPMPYPWISLGGDEYAKRPLRFNYQYSSQFNPPSTEIYEYSWQVGSGMNFDNGLKLQSIFEFFVGQSCPNLTLKSDFFQWNPENVSSINYVTEEQSQVLNLILFQKSDIKRPNVSGNATIAEISFEALLNDICNMFNLLWDIDEETNQFIIEHVSFFNKNVGLNLVGRFDERLRAGLNQYEYDVDNMPKRETFQMLDSKNQYTRDFVGLPIVYENSCAGLGDKKEEPFIVENIMTDIEHCLRNSSSDNSIVSDDGFVLVACDQNNGIIVEVPILDSYESANNSLGWAHLHEKYWKHNRVFKQMNMNGVDQEAITVKPTRKQVQLTAILCCDDEFNPDDKVVTGLGEGTVQGATFNLFSETLQLDLLFDVTETNQNEPPVAVNDVAETFVNLSIDIDVLANDTDPDGDIDEDSIEIVYVSNGTASVVDKKIRFVPTPDFVGTAFVFYKIKDSYQEESNQARVDITVKSGSPLPIANADTFTIVKNGTLSEGDVLANDTGDGALQCVPETKTTSQGGSIQINSNGSFIYTPAVDFVGTDTVQYTMKDSNDNTAIGTASFVVFAGSMVYATLDTEEADQFLECDYNSNEEVVFGGNVIAEKYRVRFYSDSGKTIPLDVTNYGIDIILKYDQTNGNPHTGQYQYNNIEGGTSFLINEWLVVDFDPCVGDISPSYSRAYYLAPSTQYTIV